MISRITRQFVCIAVVVSFVGCGPASRGSMNGKVIYQGKPVCVGTVTVVSADNSAAFGSIEADGTYTVNQIVAGPVRIAVHSPQPPKEAQSVITETRSRPEKPKPPPGGVKWFAIPEQFADA